MLADRNKIDALIETALYDTGGELVEGGFGDHWDTYAGRANAELASIYKNQDFTPTDAALIQEALSQSEAPLEAVVSLAIELARWVYPLAQTMRHSTSPHERRVAVRILGDTSFLWRCSSQQKLDLAVLLEGLADADAGVREAAVKMLSPLMTRKQEPQAEDALILALQDTAPSVRKAAGVVIAFLNRPEGAAALLACLGREPDQEVRQTLLLAVAAEIRREGIHVGAGRGLPLRQQVGEPLLALLLSTLSDPQPALRRAIAEALHVVRGVDVGEALLECLLKEQDPDVRSALLPYPDHHYCYIAERSVPALTALLESDPSIAIRCQAVWVLACNLAARPILRDALANPLPEVRAAATRALELRFNR